MKYSLTLLALVLTAFAAGAQDPAERKFPRGAKPTPAHRIAAAVKSGAVTLHKAVAAPSQVVVAPKRLSMWGNSQYGCCVTSESVFAIADYSTYVGLDEIFVTEADAIAWARARNFLNGADLLSVIEKMQSDGIKDEKGSLRKAGASSVVDYTAEATLQSAIAQGPVSIAIDANALPSGAGNKSGWYAFGGGRFPNTDHCVSLCGYGPSAALFAALGVPTPANAPANGYYLYTWSTIGVVDHKWLLNTCVEAWVRNPTTTGLPSPTPPPPPPPPVGKARIIVQIPGQPDQVFPFTLPTPAPKMITPDMTLQQILDLIQKPAQLPAKDEPKKSSRLDDVERLTLERLAKMERLLDAIPKKPVRDMTPIAPARVTVWCEAGAYVSFNGQSTVGRSSFRSLHTPPLPAGEFKYNAVVIDSAGRRDREVLVQAGKETVVDFRL